MTPWNREASMCSLFVLFACVSRCRGLSCCRWCCCLRILVDRARWWLCIEALHTYITHSNALGSLINVWFCVHFMHSSQRQRTKIRITTNHAKWVQQRETNIQTHYSLYGWCRYKVQFRYKLKLVRKQSENIDSKRSHFTQIYKLIRTCFGFEFNVPTWCDCPSTIISARMWNAVFRAFYECNMK